MTEIHISGAKKNECPACCCGGGDIHEKCGGTWHEILADDTAENGFIHNYRCDRCNKEDFQHGYEDIKIEFSAC